MKFIALMASIFNLIIIAILSFENLFFAKARYYILFWEINNTVTWVILGSFLSGIIFSVTTFLFLYSSPASVQEDNKDSDSW